MSNSLFKAYEKGRKKTFHACREGKQPYGDKDIVVIERMVPDKRGSMFSAFYQKAPDFKGEGMSWEEAVAMLILRDVRLKLATEKKEGLFTVFFNVNKARAIKGYGFSQKTAIVDLLRRSGGEIYVHFAKAEDLAKTG